MNKEELIFTMYRDTPIVAKTFKSKIIKKYGLSNDEARDIYVRIQNYQIKKYGGALMNKMDLLPAEEWKKINEYARIRTNNKKYNYYENRKENKKYSYL